jgi:hypothetical protein
MPEITIEYLQLELSKYPLSLLRDFVDNFLMPYPTSTKCSTFKIKTSDNFYYHVWGKNPDEVWNKFQRFLDLRLFL